MTPTNASGDATFPAALGCAPRFQSTLVLPATAGEKKSAKTNKKMQYLTYWYDKSYKPTHGQGTNQRTVKVQTNARLRYHRQTHIVKGTLVRAPGVRNFTLTHIFFEVFNKTFTRHSIKHYDSVLRTHHVGVSKISNNCDWTERNLLLSNIISRDTLRTYDRCVHLFEGGQSKYETLSSLHHKYHLSLWYRFVKSCLLLRVRFQRFHVSECRFPRWNTKTSTHTE